MAEAKEGITVLATPKLWSAFQFLPCAVETREEQEVLLEALSLELLTKSRLLAFSERLCEPGLDTTRFGG
jgi:hypothetical protein